MEPSTPLMPDSSPAPSAPVAQPSGGSDTSSMLIGLFAGLLIGGVGGWYLGYMMNFSPKIGQMLGMPAQPVQNNTMPAEMQVQSAPEAGNPLESLETNPYADVKVNPFDE